ncbi:MAG: putative toxin-antitoxin system toxin component, PIN family, partial [Actinomycetota bacterium]
MSVERAVLDPGELKSGLISPGSFGEKLLVAWTEGAFELVVSPKLLGELDQELTRPQMRRFFPASRARGFIDQLRSKGVFLADPESDPDLASNLGRQYLLALARTSGAGFLVSSDPHLIGLSDVS